MSAEPPYEGEIKGIPRSAVEKAWSLAHIRQRTALGWVLRYGMAVVAVAVATGLRLALTAWVGSGLPLFITFYPAVMVAALLAGFGPGFLATALTVVAAAYWFLPPLGGFSVDAPVDRLSLVLFGCLGLFMSIVAELYRRSRDRATAYARELALREGEEALRHQADQIDPLRAEIIAREMLRAVRERGGLRDAEKSVAAKQGVSIFLRRGIRIAGGAAILIGSFWLAAWLGGFAARWSAEPDAIIMKTNMALGQILAGASLLLVAPGAKGLRRRIFGAVLAAIVLCLGALTLSEHLFHWDLGIDQLLASEAPGAKATASPNRIGPPGSLSLALLGMGLLGLACKRWTAAVCLGLAVCAVNLLPAVGFLYGIDPFYSRPLTGIAWPTVLGLSMLGLGLVAAQRESPAMALLLRDDLGGALLRRLLPGALLVPLVVGFFGVQGERLGWYDMASGAGGVMIIMALVLSALVFWAGHAMSRAERRRAEAETQLRNLAELMDQAYEPLIVRELGGVIRVWNRGAAALYGWLAAEALGRHRRSLLRIEDSLAEEIDRELRSAGHWEGELVHTTRDGRRVIVDSRQTASRIGDGQVFILESNRDITERKQAEEAASRSQQTFAELVEHSPFGIYVIDSQFRIAQMNAASQTGAFRNVRPVIGRDFAEAMRILWPEPVAAEIIAIFHHTLDTGEPYCSPRFINPRHDVETVESYEWELHRTRMADGSYGVVCYYFDSTELREAEAAVRRSEERWNAAIEHFGEGAIIATEAEQVIYWNPAARAMHGFTSADEGIGPLEETPNTFELWTPDGSHLLALEEWPMRRIKRGETVRRLELRLRRPGQGWERIVSYSGAMVDTASGERLIFLSVYDLSEQRKAEEELRRNREWLRVTLSSIGDAVIAGDPETRITFMNSAAAALTGWTEEEALGQPMNRIFNLVDEQTRQPAEPPCLRALKEKRTVSMDGYSALIAKDGREFPIEESAAPILDSAGNVAGVVLVFHDVTEQRLAQRALQLSNDELEILVAERTAELSLSMELLGAERKRFQDVLDQLPAYLILLSKDYHVPFANRFFEERFGKSNGKRCYEYLFQRTEPCENCETFKVMETGAPHRWEWTGPDGRDYEIHDFPFTDVDGSMLIMEVGLDVTERKKAEAELDKYRQHLEELVQERTTELEAINQQYVAEIIERTQAQEALRASRMAALNLAEDAVEAHRQVEQASMALRESQVDLSRAQAVGNIGSWRLDIRCNELRWSEQNHRIFGISQGTPLTYEAFLGTVHPDDRAFVNEKWEAALRGELYDIEHRIVVEGAVKWVCQRAELEFDKQGELLGGFGTTQDITERKRAQEALRLSEERLRLALQAGKLATWDWQVATGETIWNDDLYRMLGYERDAIEPGFEAWIDRIHAEDRETTVAAFLAAMNEGTEFNGEYRACWPDGTVRWLWALGGFERDAAGKPLRSYGVLLDITEQKEAELYIQELNEALQEHLATIETVNKDLQSYSHSVSHDLRTPLRFVNRIAYMLLNDPKTPLPESAAQQVDMILQSTTEMEELIQNLLEFAEIGRKPMKKRRVDLRRLFQEVSRELVLDGRNVEIAIQDLASCQGDPGFIF